MKRSILLAAALVATLAGAGWAQARQTARSNGGGHDWLRFGGDAASSGASDTPTGITAANVAALHHLTVDLPGPSDASAVYLHGVTIGGAPHDAFFLTTIFGKTLAVDANDGTILWTYTPTGYDTWASTRQVTNASPMADADRQYLYAASPDGHIQKLAVSDGHALWSTAVTLLPLREKLPSPLNEYKGHLIVTTDGYNGDRPPYQGHVAILDAQSGKLLSVWNALCSDRTGLIEPSSCAATDGGIWGRAGAVVDENGGIWVATGNATWDGKTNWGDAVLELDPGATKLLANYTPTNTAQLNDDDLDIGSTSPVLLGGDFIAQGGKDAKIRLLSRKAMTGAAPHQGGELQIVDTPSGAMLFTAPVVWHQAGTTWMFAADNGGTAAWTLEQGQLVQKWKNANGGTSPLLAGGLLYVYDPKGGLRVYTPQTGEPVATLACGAGHWSSPVVIDGHIALPEGNANRRLTAGVLDLWNVK